MRISVSYIYVIQNSQNFPKNQHFSFTTPQNIQILILLCTDMMAFVCSAPKNYSHFGHTLIRSPEYEYRPKCNESNCTGKMQVLALAYMNRIVLHRITITPFSICLHYNFSTADWSQPHIARLSPSPAISLFFIYFSVFCLFVLFFFSISANFRYPEIVSGVFFYCS